MDALPKLTPRPTVVFGEPPYSAGQSTTTPPLQDETAKPVEATKLANPDNRRLKIACLLAFQALTAPEQQTFLDKADKIIEMVDA